MDRAPPLPFDEALLESQFALASVRPAKRKRSSTDSESGRQLKCLRVLDDSTSNRLAIAFRSLPPPDALAAVLTSLDGFPESLPSEPLLALNAAVSEQREAVEQIRRLVLGGSGRDAAQLDLPERYLWALSVVPGCATRLACGALIVGSAAGLTDLRYSFDRVGECCQALRRSRVLRQVVATSLAVGNVLNRGTPRADAVAVVLPDALQKLEELRGVGGPDEEKDGEPEPRGPTALDFIAHALVQGAGLKGEGGPLREVDELLRHIRAARSVHLSEEEANIGKVSAEVFRVRRVLAEEMGEEAGLARMTRAVDKISEEVCMCVRTLDAAKSELARLQEWSCARSQVKIEEWWSNWAAFLDSLGRALQRAPRPSPRPVEALRSVDLNVACGTRGTQEEELLRGRAKEPPTIIPTEEKVQPWQLALLHAKIQEQPLPA